jgi:hypothetical protein
MLAGRPAYQGDSEMATALARLTGPPTPLASIRPDVPAGLVAALDHALQPDPAHRIPSAAAFGELLERGPAAMPPRPATAPPARPAAATRPAPANPTRVQPRPRPAAPPKRRQGGWLRVLVFLIFLALLGIAAGVVTAQLADDNGGGGGGSGGGRSGSNGGGSSNAAALTSAAVIDFDPFGDKGAASQENREQVDLAVDQNPGTAWHSESYSTRNFGNAKPGVGLVLNLPDEADVSAVEIDANAGYDVAIYVADAPADTLDGWGAPRESATDLPAGAKVALSPSARGRAVLVWFTRLPESNRLDVAELRVA